VRENTIYDKVWSNLTVVNNPDFVYKFSLAAGKDRTAGVGLLIVLYRCEKPMFAIKQTKPVEAA
jgi:hypothetical protein